MTPEQKARQQREQVKMPVVGNPAMAGRTGAFVILIPEYGILFRNYVANKGT
jgi:hypothetical protein